MTVSNDHGPARGEAPATADLLRRKRDGERLDDTDIAALVVGIADGRVADAQLGAFAMAVRLRGMDADEIAELTRAMRDSGRVLRWPDLPGPVLDKHSTGGVGDCVSLILAPLIAACGGFVPMISGRALGHTGGTLDKLEAIPGYDCHPDTTTFRTCVREVGAAIIGAGPELAPADQRLYAVRDVTATVDAPALIVASILAKKLAAGLDALVLDVKRGSGAGLAGDAAAQALADSLRRTAEHLGLPTRVRLTNMDQPLADAVGNAVEVRAALRVLDGRDRDSRLRAVTLTLAETLWRAAAPNEATGAVRTRLERVLDDGSAAERFARMVARLGGPVDLLEHAERHLPRATVVAPVPIESETPLYLRRIDAAALGRLVVELGGGRRRPDQTIDPAVGLSEVAPLGALLAPGVALATVHAGSPEGWRRAATALRAACTLGPEPLTPPILFDPE